MKKNTIILENPIFKEFLYDLEAVNVTPISTGKHKFAVYGARTNARWWLIPVDNQYTAAAGLELLHPVTWKAALAKKLAKLVTQFGLHTMLGSTHIYLSGCPEIGNNFNKKQNTFAYFTGTDGPHRKTTIQVMDLKGEIIGYAKISRHSEVKSFIKNEAIILDKLNKLELKSVDIPHVLSIIENDKCTVLVTDTTKTSAQISPKFLTAEHRIFLNELAELTTHKGASQTLNFLTQTLDGLREKIPADWFVRITKVINILRPNENDLLVGLAHGDFTPWNTFIQNGRLYVFDWEYANYNYPIGYDELHFLLATSNKKFDENFIKYLISELANFRFNSNLKQAWEAILLSLAIHATFYLHRSLKTNQSFADSEDAVMRAHIMDFLQERGFVI